MCGLFVDITSKVKRHDRETTNRHILTSSNKYNTSTINTITSDDNDVTHTDGKAAYTVSTSDA